jgi:hypothetical protein
LSSDTLTQAKKQGIIREQEEEQEAADKDRQIRLAANEEAKVSNLVDISCKLIHYVLPIA